MDNNSENLDKSNKPTFEESYEIIDKLLNINSRKWNLAALPWLSWEDVKQIILIHLWKKWEQYDSTKGELGPWVNRIIGNQIKNIRRNVYTSNTRPCLQNCPFNEGNDLCGFTSSGKQTSECKLFKKWEKGKKNAYSIRLPLPIENHSQEISNIPFENFDIEKNAKLLHDKILPLLRDNEKKVYILLYIDGLSEEDAAKILNYKTNENRKAGYNNFIRIKKSILIKVKKHIQDIDFL